MKYRFLAPALALALLLSGCQIVRNTHFNITKTESSAANADSNMAITIGNYADLKTELLKLVERGTQEAVLTAENYKGELAQDCDDAINYFLHDNPKTSYVVQSIVPDLTQVGIYNKLNLSISYYNDRNYADLKNVPTVFNDADMKSSIQNALESNALRLFLLVIDYNETKYSTQSFEAIVNECFQADPVSIIAKPEVVSFVSPNQGADRIIELKFTYRMNPEDQKGLTTAELDVMKNAVASLIKSAEDYVAYSKSDIEKATQLYSYLVGLHRYTIGESNAPAYKLLIDGVADKRTFAYVYSKMCERVDLTCEVVSGKKDGEDYCWNIIEVNGSRCHMDLFADEQSALRSPRFLADDQLEGYTWNTTVYRECTGLPETPAPANETSPQEHTGAGEQATPSDPSSTEQPAEPDDPEPTQPKPSGDLDPE